MNEELSREGPMDGSIAHVYEMTEDGMSSWSNDVHLRFRCQNQYFEVNVQLVRDRRSLFDETLL